MENALEMKYNKEALVVQANELIRSLQEDYTLLEAKLIRLAISQITMDDTDLKTYTCRITDLASFLEIPPDNIYRDIQPTLDNLMSKVITIIDKSRKPKKNGDYPWKKFHWVDTCYYNNGIITLKMSNELKPYLLGLNHLFTEYGYDCILKLPTSYSIRLYELLVSYKNMVNIYAPNFKPTNLFPQVKKDDNELIFSLEYLKKYFNCEEKYPYNKDFINRVIDSAVKAINNKSPGSVLRVSYRTAKEGRKIGYVLFKINAWEDKDFRDFIIKNGTEWGEAMYNYAISHPIKE